MIAPERAAQGAHPAELLGARLLDPASSACASPCLDQQLAARSGCHYRPAACVLVRHSYVGSNMHVTPGRSGCHNMSHLKHWMGPCVKAQACCHATSAFALVQAFSTATWRTGDRRATASFFQRVDPYCSRKKACNAAVLVEGSPLRRLAAVRWFPRCLLPPPMGSELTKAG